MARILIADTDKATRDLVRLRFSAWGHDVVSYADGYSALQALQEEDCDLALLGVDLPRLAGLDVLRRVRAESGNTSIVMLSQFDRSGVAAQAYELGADEVVFKPFTCGFVTVFSRFLNADQAARPVAVAV